jgi:hypothetical protein
MNRKQLVDMICLAYGIEPQGREDLYNAVEIAFYEGKKAARFEFAESVEKWGIDEQQEIHGGN